MASTDGPPSQGHFDAAQSAAAASGCEEPSSSFDLPKAASPALSRSSAVPNLARTDSTLSSDRISLRSHTSIPVVGTFPLGSLQVHKIMDSPRPQRSAGPQADEISDMPPLKGDTVARGANSSAATTSSPAVGEGDIFLILDLPPHTTVGCDARAIGTAASGFQGIRDIPPGPHFIWVAEPSAMSRCGYWFVTREGRGRGEVRVKQWDKFNEVLVDPASDFEARDHKANVAILYPQLVPHGYFSGREPQGFTKTARPRVAAVPPSVDEDGEDEDAVQLWTRLTSCISEPLLARVTGRPTDAREFLVDTSDGAAGDAGGFLPQPRATQLHQAVAGAGELHFLFPEGDVDVHGFRPAAPTGDEQQQQQPPDTSDDILRLVETPGTGVAAADLVGEMQLSFLAGLHLGNLACVEQWWHLVLQVVLRAHRLALLRPELCKALLETLHAQMIYDDRYISSSPPSGADDDNEAARREYGGPGGGALSTSVLDLVPGSRRRLRAALTLYKRRLGELLLDLPRGGHGDDDDGNKNSTAGQEGVGRAFVALEAWFWRLGWDLRTDYVANANDDGQKRKKKGAGRDVGRRRQGLGTDLGDEEEQDGEEEESGGEGEDLDGEYGEEDEYRPVIVDLDEHGREVGLVSFN